MILTCPECQTRYQTDAAEFPREGRKVRCAKCGRVWHQVPPESELGPLPTVSIEAAPPFSNPNAAGHSVQAGDERRHRPRRSWAEQLGLMAGWAMLAVIIVLIGWTGFRFRREIATLWPQSNSIFATFGVAVNAHGIAIDDAGYRRETENGRPVWIVTGKLVNRSARELAVPPVRVALTDGDQRELYHWTVRPPQRILEPGQTLAFSARIPAPPPGARQVQLGFAGRE